MTATNRNTTPEPSVLLPTADVAQMFNNVSAVLDYVEAQPPTPDRAAATAKLVDVLHLLDVNEVQL